MQSLLTSLRLIGLKFTKLSRGSDATFNKSAHSAFLLSSALLFLTSAGWNTWKNNKTVGTEKCRMCTQVSKLVKVCTNVCISAHMCRDV